MYRDARIAVVLPAFDEEPRIARVVSTIPAFVDSIVVVDDCSSDRTAEAAASTGDARVVVLRTPRNSGVGGATLLGYARALEDGADVIVKMDGDGQMDPERLPALLAPLLERGFDYAKGNRFLHASHLQEMPAVRILGNAVLTFLTKLASGYWQIFDPHNGYTAIRASTLKCLDLRGVNERYFFEPDLLVRLNVERARVVDVAMPARYGDERSKLSIPRVTVTFPLLLASRFLYRITRRYVLRDFSPVALFLLTGTPMFLGGLAYGGVLWLRTIHTGIATPTGSLMLSLVPIVLGFQLLLQAMVLDIQETPR